jgi:hypothetical protein
VAAARIIGAIRRTTQAIAGYDFMAASGAEPIAAPMTRFDHRRASGSKPPPAQLFSNKIKFKSDVSRFAHRRASDVSRSHRRSPKAQKL